MTTMTIERVRAFNGLDALVAREEGLFAAEAHARASIGLAGRRNDDHVSACRAPVHIGGHVVLEPEIPALRRPLRRHERDVAAQASRLLLKVLELVVGDRPEHLAAAHETRVIDDPHRGRLDFRAVSRKMTRSHPPGAASPSAPKPSVPCSSPVLLPAVPDSIVLVYWSDKHRSRDTRAGSALGGPPGSVSVSRGVDDATPLGRARRRRLAPVHPGGLYTNGFKSTWTDPSSAATLSGRTVGAFVIAVSEPLRRTAEDALANGLTARGARGIAGYTLLTGGKPGSQRPHARGCRRPASKSPWPCGSRLANSRSVTSPRRTGAIGARTGPRPTIALPSKRTWSYGWRLEPTPSCRTRSCGSARA